ESQDKIKGLKLGAIDYITKPFDRFEVLARIRNQVSLVQWRREPDQRNTDLQRQLAITQEHLRQSERRNLAPMLGNSSAVVELREHIQRFAQKIQPTLLLGHAGCQPEAIARALHRHSERSVRPFIAVDGLT